MEKQLRSPNTLLKYAAIVDIRYKTDDVESALCVFQLTTVLHAKVNYIISLLIYSIDATRGDKESTTFQTSQHVKQSF